MSEKSGEKAKSSNIFSKINKTRLIVLVSVLSVCLVLGIFMVYAGNYADVYPNTYINGASISGMTADELKAFCEEYYEKNSVPETLNFVVDGKTFSVKSSDIGLCFDAERTLALTIGNRAENGFFSNLANYTKSIFSDTVLNPSVKIDSKKFDEVMAEYLKPYEIRPNNASYSVENNKLIIKKGNDGKKLDKALLIAEIEKNINSPSSSIPLVFAKVEGKTFNVDSLYKELTGAAKDAYYEKTSDGNVIVIADKPQIKVNKDTLKKAVESKNSSSSVAVTVIPANRTKKDLEEALFSETIGTWTSYFSTSNVARSENVRLSASRINNTILMPGESFSYDKTVGPRTAENGFKVAGVYINNKVENGIGGGICQTSSTLYSAVLYSNLEIVSRTSHSLPVSYMPAGQDATIAAGAIDFVFKNNTEYPIKIETSIEGGGITCSIIGTPVKGQKVVISNVTTASYTPSTEIETDASIPKGFKKTVKGSGGYAVSSTRLVYQDDVLVKTEPLTKSVYHATPHIVTVNPDERGVAVETLIEQGSVTDAPLPEDIELNGSESENLEEDNPSIENSDDEVIEI
ncbi:MAG: hypothetical protein E7415_01750 [Ruminococcaceae bacterium]|nr:hypothetical protein [Oscillospiraceae bacterium]